MNITLDTSKYEYLAGFIDGDGSISIVSEKQVTPYYCPKIAVYNTDYNIVEIFRKEFGGNIIIKTPKKNGHKIPYEWRLKGKSAFLLLKKFQPFLVIKKPQANLCLALYDIRNHFSRKKCNRKALLSQFEKLKSECAKLNIRGKNKKMISGTAKTEINFKYLAGMIESDGSIYTARIKSKYYRAMITVTNCDKDLVYSIRDKYGGSKTKYIPSKKNENVVYSWNICGKNAQYIIEGIFPFLQIKKRQARLLLRLIKLQKKYNSATRRWNSDLNIRCLRVYNKLYKKCSGLNERGKSNVNK